MWNEILAGLAGAAQGGAQGLGQINDMRQQDIAQRLRDRQIKMQEEQQKRQAVQQAWESTQEGHVFETPEQATEFVNLGYGVIKDPVTGRPMKPKSIQTRAAELNLQNAEADQPLLNLKREATMEMADPNWLQKPLDYRQVRGGIATGRPAVMTPQENLTFDPAYRASLADNATQLKVAEIGAGQRAQDSYFDFIVAQSKQKYEEAKAARGEDVKLASEAWDIVAKTNPYAKPAQLAEAADAIYAAKRQQLGGAGQPSQGGGGSFVAIRPR